MINIYRYSRDGFVAKEQTYFKGYIQHCKSAHIEYNDQLTEYAKLMITIGKRALLDWLKDNPEHEIHSGIFVFLCSPDHQDVPFLLNHLRTIDTSEHRWWSAQCPDTMKVYTKLGAGGYVEDIGELKTDGYLECFVPQRQSHQITNIQQIVL